MAKKLEMLFLMVSMGIVVAGCANSAPDDVPSLAATPTPVAQQEKVLSDEEKMMAFVECMRDRGVLYKDPVVDSDGNVQRPGFVEGYTATRTELRALRSLLPPHRGSHFRES